MANDDAQVMTENEIAASDDVQIMTQEEIAVGKVYIEELDLVMDLAGFWKNPEGVDTPIVVVDEVPRFLWPVYGSNVVVLDWMMPTDVSPLQNGPKFLASFNGTVEVDGIVYARLVPCLDADIGLESHRIITEQGLAAPPGTTFGDRLGPLYASFLSTLASDILKDARKHGDSDQERLNAAQALCSSISTDTWQVALRYLSRL